MVTSNPNDRCGIRMPIPLQLPFKVGGIVLTLGRGVERGWAFIQLTRPAKPRFSCLSCQACGGRLGLLVQWAVLGCKMRDLKIGIGH